MNLNISVPTVIVAVIASTIISIAFPDWARKQIQRYTPWGGDPETAQPVSGSVKVSAAWGQCEV